MNNTLYLLDGYGLIYRAYFAFIHRPLTDRDGNNVSAVHGFFRSLLALEREFIAERIYVSMYPPGPTFRHDFYPEYKANRDPAPEDLHAQVPLIREILELMGIPVFLVDGFEADDVMGSVAEIYRKEGLKCRLVSSDKDLMQLVDEEIHLLRPGKGGGFIDMGPSEVLEEKGVRPDQIVDYLALIGDASDNIPGVAGIGPKTASALLGSWDTLENLYQNLESAAKGARLKKLEEGREQAFFSQNLVTIRKDLPLSEELTLLESMKPDYHAASEKFRERDMRSLAAELRELAGSGNFSGLPSLSEPHPGKEAGDSAPGLIPEKKYSSILREEQMAEWGRRIREAGIVALDTETDSLDPMRAALVGLSVSVKAGEAAYLPIRCPDTVCLGETEVVKWLSELFADGKIRIIGQNFKYDMKVLRRAGVAIGGAWFDTMIAAWVLDASSPVGMDALADRYLGVSTVKFKEVVPKGGTFAEVPLEKAVDYAAEDADITWRLYEVFSPLLEADEKRRIIFRDMEMPLQPILAGMEMEGIGLDIFELEAYGEELRTAIDSLVKEIHTLCGHEFNIASPKQLQKVLFEERGLTPGKKTKTGYSTDNSVLSDLAAEDPVPEKILLYRSLSKLKSTYVDVLPQLVHPADGRIHTSYSQTGAATGRLSSNNPNLQNIPIRDENGRRIRTAFKSRPGYVFVSADYSQIELVVLAHMSGDEALSAAFRDGVDVHAETAALLLGIDSRDVSPEQRRMAKAVNFGVMYGMSAFRLSNELGISRKEAGHFIDAYFATYSGIRQFVEETVAQAEKDGGVRTLYGRFRPLPGINSRNRVEKAAAERAAVNSRIQGTAADIIKTAMIHVDEALSRKFPDGRMLLQVHDELLIEAPRETAADLSSFLKDTMERAVKLTVPLRAGVETGGSWGDIH
jgi:DNA polymerase-1